MSAQPSDPTMQAWQQPDMPSKLRAPLRVPPAGPTTYYVASFWPQSGFSIKQGVTVNTLTAGP